VTNLVGVGQRVAEGALTGLRLGAPGVYFAPVVPSAPLVVEAMDVACFVGVSARGPAWELVDDPTLNEQGPFRARSVAVPVDSLDDYLELFGGFDCPGLLPHAVAAFFAQGGRRAYVVRVVNATASRTAQDVQPLGCALFDLAAAGRPSLKVRARNEGVWGNGLTIALSFTRRSLAATRRSPFQIALGPGGVVPVGTTLRVSDPQRSSPSQPAPALTIVSAVSRVRRADDVGYDIIATLDRPTAMSATTFEVVEGELTLDDGDLTRLRRERLTALGLSPLHPRFLVDVVRTESRLVEFIDAGSGIPLPDPDLPDLVARAVESEPGTDRWDLITLDDVFSYANEPAGTGGVDAVANAPEVATLVVPDLYAAGGQLPPPKPPDPVRLSPHFETCAPRPASREDAPPPRGLDKLRRDPTVRAELLEIVAQQQRLVALAESEQLVVLLDVPPGLRPAEVLRWRSNFDSSYAAAYHPWLRGTGPGNSLAALPPSAVAAGVIAHCELRDGISRGAANEVARGVVDVAEQVDDQVHAELHRLGIDVYRMEPDGVRLTGARTLSMDSAWRQLSVRRLLLLIERAVRRQLQWTVFEPNDAQLRESLRQQLDAMLATLFEQGCFAGATAEDSWFVHVTPPAGLSAEADRGQLIVEVGVAPSEPLEFIVVQVVLTEGTTKSSVTRGPGPGVLSRV
jgi:uncharacterized protein